MVKGGSLMEWRKREEQMNSVVTGIVFIRDLDETSGRHTQEGIE